MADSPPPLVATHPQVILEKLRSGEFFREARMIYHQRYHDIMAERYLYLAITALSVFILLVAVVAVNLFFPLKTNVPFIYTTNDSVNEVPRMQAMGQVDSDPNMVLRQFLVSNYVRVREEYNVNMIERSANGVKSQSTPEVFASYQATMNPQNPDSPIARFQRRATRSVRVIDIRPTASDLNQMQVRFEALVEEGLVRRKEMGVANITFSFADIQVNQSTGATTPLEFTVTDYHSNPVQE
jgi:type IV secretory pathway component VirB8